MLLVQLPFVQRTSRWGSRPCRSPGRAGSVAVWDRHLSRLRIFATLCWTSLVRRTAPQASPTLLDRPGEAGQAARFLDLWRAAFDPATGVMRPGRYYEAAHTHY